MRQLLQITLFDDTSLNTLVKFIRVHDVTCLPNVLISFHSDVDAHRDEQIFVVNDFFIVTKHCCFVEVSSGADGNFFEYCWLSCRLWRAGSSASVL